MKKVFIIKESTYDLWDDTCKESINSIWATAESAEKEIERLRKYKTYLGVEITCWIERWNVQS